MAGKITKEELHHSLITFIENIANAGQHITEQDIHDIISNTVVNGAPEALNTLKKISDSINNDPNFNDTIRKYANDLVNNVIDSAPENLNTLKKISNSINNDPDFITTMYQQLEGVQKTAGDYAKNLVGISEEQLKFDYLPTNFLPIVKKDVADFNEIKPGIFTVSTTSTPALNPPYDPKEHGFADLYGTLINIPRGKSMVQFYIDANFAFVRYNLGPWKKITTVPQ